jgi:hypothetical protein
MGWFGGDSGLVGEADITFQQAQAAQGIVVGVGLELVIVAESAADSGKFGLGEGEDAGFSVLGEGKSRRGVRSSLCAMAIGFAAATAQGDEGASQGGDGVEGGHGPERGEFWRASGDILKRFSPVYLLACTLTDMKSRHQRIKPRKRPAGRTPPAASFIQACFACLCPEATLRRLCRYRSASVGAPPLLPVSEVVLGLIFHAVLTVGTLAEHLQLLSGRRYAESTLAERRAALPWRVWADILRRALRPLADKRRHPHAFYRQWRLVAIDGTQFSLQNTPQNLRALPKAKSRRGRAAFSKLSVSVLLEIGLHQPLAAAVGRQGQSEWALSVSLLSHLARGYLLLADRLYGCAAFAAQALEHGRRCGSAFLFRVRTPLKARTIKRFKDGSRLIELDVRDPKCRSRILQTIQLREIVVRCARRGGRVQILRLWTNLLDLQAAPALELAQLYAKRWEHELYYRQMKRELRDSPLLLSQTPDTAAQEVAAMILATSLLAHQRLSAGDQGHPAHRISFVKTLALVRPLWIMLALAGAFLSERQLIQIWAQFVQIIRHQSIPKKRHRSCQRKLRQPVSKWPRMIAPTYRSGQINIAIRP